MNVGTPSTDKIKDFYNKLFAEAFSPNGKYLAVADRYGQITIFNLATLLLKAEEKSSDCFFRVAVKSCPLYTLLTKGPYLVCGCADGSIVGFLWSNLEKQKATTSFQLNTYSSDGRNCLEINSLLDIPDENAISNRLCAAGGDDKIHLWDFEQKKVISSFSGHSDYIHCLASLNSNSVVSGSEDGTVRFWDFRSRSCIHAMNPSAISECSRPRRGKWIGCVAVEKDWMVCGGGPALGFYHLGSYSLVKPLSVADVDFHSVLFYDDKIIGAGDKYSLHHWNYRGDFITDVPVSALTTYDIKVNASSNKFKVLCSCGTGSKINVFVNLGYSAFTIDVKS